MQGELKKMKTRKNSSKKRRVEREAKTGKIVRWFNDKKGYRFITSEDGKHAFVHSCAKDSVVEIPLSNAYIASEPSSQENKKLKKKFTLYALGMDNNLEDHIRKLTKGLEPNEALATASYLIEIDKDMKKISDNIEKIENSYSRSHKIVEEMKKEAKSYGYKG